MSFYLRDRLRAPEAPSGWLSSSARAMTGRQRIVQLVGHAREELPHGRKLSLWASSARGGVHAQKVSETAEPLTGGSSRTGSLRERDERDEDSAKLRRREGLAWLRLGCARCRVLPRSATS